MIETLNGEPVPQGFDINKESGELQRASLFTLTGLDGLEFLVKHVDWKPGKKLSFEAFENEDGVMYKTLVELAEKLPTLYLSVYNKKGMGCRQYAIDPKYVTFSTSYDWDATTDVAKWDVEVVL